MGDLKNDDEIVLKLAKLSGVTIQSDMVRKGTRVLNKRPAVVPPALPNVESSPPAITYGGTAVSGGVHHHHHHHHPYENGFAGGAGAKLVVAGSSSGPVGDDICPRCGDPYDTQGRRKLTEECGHSRCRLCVLNEDGCTICNPPPVATVIVEEVDSPRLNHNHVNIRSINTRRSAAAARQSATYSRTHSINSIRPISSSPGSISNDTGRQSSSVYSDSADSDSCLRFPTTVIGTAGGVVEVTDSYPATIDFDTMAELTSPTLVDTNYVGLSDFSATVDTKSYSSIVSEESEFSRNLMSLREQSEPNLNSNHNNGGIPIHRGLITRAQRKEMPSLSLVTTSGSMTTISQSYSAQSSSTSSPPNVGNRVSGSSKRRSRDSPAVEVGSKSENGAGSPDITQLASRDSTPRSSRLANKVASPPSAPEAAVGSKLSALLRSGTTQKNTRASTGTKDEYHSSATQHSNSESTIEAGSSQMVSEAAKPARKSAPSTPEVKNEPEPAQQQQPQPSPPSTSNSTEGDQKEDEDPEEGKEKEEPVPKKKKKRSPVVIHDHITILGGEPPMYQCNLCNKKFKTKAHIKYHEFCQKGDKPFKCETCGQGFIAKSHYEYHIRTHTGERPYTCPKCGKGFNQQGKVTRHMRSHTGEKPFVCQECNRGFANAQALRCHTLIHTGERPFACTYCNKRFTGMTNLKKHVITHTGERPFSCTHCGKSFGLKWTLDLHLRTHSTERPYACDQCTRAFSNSKDLRRHLVIHSGERPFKCWICGTAFRRKDNLDRHIKNTHNQPKEVAKQLANEAAAEYLKNNSKNQSLGNIPVSKVNSIVISNIIRNNDLMPAGGLVPNNRFKTDGAGSSSNAGASTSTTPRQTYPVRQIAPKVQTSTSPAKAASSTVTSQASTSTPSSSVQQLKTSPSTSNSSRQRKVIITAPLSPPTTRAGKSKQSDGSGASTSSPKAAAASPPKGKSSSKGKKAGTAITASKSVPEILQVVILPPPPQEDGEDGSKSKKKSKKKKKSKSKSSHKDEVRHREEKSKERVRAPPSPPIQVEFSTKRLSRRRNSGSSKQEVKDEDEGDRSILILGSAPSPPRRETPTLNFCDLDRRPTLTLVTAQSPKVEEREQPANHVGQAEEDQSGVKDCERVGVVQDGDDGDDYDDRGKEDQMECILPHAIDDEDEMLSISERFGDSPAVLLNEVLEADPDANLKELAQVGVEMEDEMETEKKDVEEERVHTSSKQNSNVEDLLPVSPQPPEHLFDDDDDDPTFVSDGEEVAETVDENAFEMDTQPIAESAKKVELNGEPMDASEGPTVAENTCSPSAGENAAVVDEAEASKTVISEPSGKEVEPDTIEESSHRQLEDSSVDEQADKNMEETVTAEPDAVAEAFTSVTSPTELVSDEEDQVDEYEGEGEADEADANLNVSHDDEHEEGEIVDQELDDAEDQVGEKEDVPAEPSTAIDSTTTTSPKPAGTQWALTWFQKALREKEFNYTSLEQMKLAHQGEENSVGDQLQMNEEPPSPPLPIIVSVCSQTPSASPPATIPADLPQADEEEDEKAQSEDALSDVSSGSFPTSEAEERKMLEEADDELNEGNNDSQVDEATQELCKISEVDNLPENKLPEQDELPCQMVEESASVPTTALAENEDAPLPCEPCELPGEKEDELKSTEPEVLDDTEGEQSNTDVLNEKLNERPDDMDKEEHINSVVTGKDDDTSTNAEFEEEGLEVLEDNSQDATALIAAKLRELTEQVTLKLIEKDMLEIKEEEIDVNERWVADPPPMPVRCEQGDMLLHIKEEEEEVERELVSAHLSEKMNTFEEESPRSSPLPTIPEEEEKELDESFEKIVEDENSLPGERDARTLELPALDETNIESSEQAETEEEMEVDVPKSPTGSPAPSSTVEVNEDSTAENLGQVETAKLESQNEKVVEPLVRLDEFTKMTEETEEQASPVGMDTSEKFETEEGMHTINAKSPEEPATKLVAEEEEESTDAKSPEDLGTSITPVEEEQDDMVADSVNESEPHFDSIPAPHSHIASESPELPAEDEEVDEPEATSIVSENDLEEERIPVAEEEELHEPQEIDDKNDQCHQPVINGLDESSHPEEDEQPLSALASLPASPIQTKTVGESEETIPTAVEEQVNGTPPAITIPAHEEDEEEEEEEVSVVKTAIRIPLHQEEEDEEMAADIQSEEEIVKEVPSSPAGDAQDDHSENDEPNYVEKDEPSGVTIGQPDQAVSTSLNKPKSPERSDLDAEWKVSMPRLILVSHESSPPPPKIRSPSPSSEAEEGQEEGEQEGEMPKAIASSDEPEQSADDDDDDEDRLYMDESYVTPNVDSVASAGDQEEPEIQVASEEQEELQSSSPPSPANASIPNSPIAKVAPPQPQDDMIPSPVEPDQSNVIEKEAKKEKSPSPQPLTASVRMDMISTKFGVVSATPPRTPSPSQPSNPGVAVPVNPEDESSRSESIPQDISDFVLEILADKSQESETEKGEDLESISSESLASPQSDVENSIKKCIQTLESDSEDDEAPNATPNTAAQPKGACIRMSIGPLPYLSGIGSSARLPTVSVVASSTVATTTSMFQPTEKPVIPTQKSPQLRSEQSKPEITLPSPPRIEESPVPPIRKQSPEPITLKNRVTPSTSPVQSTLYKSPNSSPKLIHNHEETSTEFQSPEKLPLVPEYKSPPMVPQEEIPSPPNKPFLTNGKNVPMADSITTLPSPKISSPTIVSSEPEREEVSKLGAPETSPNCSLPTPIANTIPPVIKTVENQLPCPPPPVSSTSSSSVMLRPPTTPTPAPRKPVRLNGLLKSITTASSSLCSAPEEPLTRPVPGSKRGREELHQALPTRVQFLLPNGQQHQSVQLQPEQHLVPVGVTQQQQPPSTMAYDPSLLYFVQPDGQQAMEGNYKLVYAAAAATAERDEGVLDGPPNKVRLIYAEALGVGNSPQNGEELQFYYAAATPDQQVQHSSTPCPIQLMEPYRVTYSRETNDATSEILQYQVHSQQPQPSQQPQQCQQVQTPPNLNPQQQQVLNLSVNSPNPVYYYSTQQNLVQREQSQSTYSEHGSYYTTSTAKLMVSDQNAYNHVEPTHQYQVDQQQQQQQQQHHHSQMRNGEIQDLSGRRRLEIPVQMAQNNLITYAEVQSEDAARYADLLGKAREMKPLFPQGALRHCNSNVDYRSSSGASQQHSYQQQQQSLQRPSSMNGMDMTGFPNDMRSNGTNSGSPTSLASKLSGLEMLQCASASLEGYDYQSKCAHAAAKAIAAAGEIARLQRLGSQQPDRVDREVAAPRSTVSNPLHHSEVPTTISHHNNVSYPSQQQHQQQPLIKLSAPIPDQHLLHRQQQQQSLQAHPPQSLHNHRHHPYASPQQQCGPAPPPLPPPHPHHMHPHPHPHVRGMEVGTTVTEVDQEAGIRRGPRKYYLSRSAHLRN